MMNNLIIQTNKISKILPMDFTGDPTPSKWRGTGKEIYNREIISFLRILPLAKSLSTLS